MNITKNILRLFFWHDKKYIKSRIDTALYRAQKSGLLDPSSREMIEGIMEFTHILVREIMIPRTEIVAVSTEATMDEIIDEVIESRHTRIPVYRGTIDNIVGILNVKDMLKFWSKQITKDDLLACLNTPYYIPETKNTHLLFYELKENKKNMAIVIDEYGGTAGLITLEDLLEEIVGELRDEHETTSVADGFLQLPDGSIIFDGRMEIENVEEHLNVNLKKGKYETLSGLILNSTKRIPLSGEKFQIEGLEVTIENAGERSIKKVRIKKIEINNLNEK
ncbi:CBS domain protein [Smithella sp. ME-1]|uniref:Magnesium and cobalt efflux protein corc n=1 Tax=hydrocarbon metagenome TaxID=938273 RepID=A0A0W8FL60_9ZZZZ|nr:CBS domain protein [Smithella sp. ME-1]